MSTKENNFWEKTRRPIKILAPMAGYTDSAFRLICRQYGADVVITELISADAIAYAKLKVKKSKIKTKEDLFIYNKVISTKNHSTAELLSFFEAERPIVIQLFGKYPEKFGLATKWISDNLKPDGIDINMGCPARKVVGSDHGAALLKKPDLAVEIIKAVKSNTDLPVSVKTRLGWENDDEILKFAPKLYDAGIDAIIIHGRTYKDGFKGRSRWDNIYKVKEMFGDKLVVIGNGDIVNSSQFSVLSSQLRNLNGFAIGRGAFGKPWVFNEMKDSGDISVQELQKVITRHARLAYETKGDHGIVEFRKHLLVYLKGFENAKLLRIEATKIKTLADIDKIIVKLKQSAVDKDHQI